jgi:hypothetical protein
MDYDFSSTNSMDLVDRRQSEFSSDSADVRVLISCCPQTSDDFYWESYISNIE